MNILVIGCKSDGKRLFLKCGLHRLYYIDLKASYTFVSFDSDIGCLGSRVEAVGAVITLSTRSVGVVALEHGKFVAI